ncbi:amino acid adenylation domain-containing protein [Mycobacterium sp. RTGN6]|uniref:amino acid adenylation domain-containing protein n=1 Tax=Mycobacterium sp. RTGN6 TaxID=3016521 RepID=UPI0029C913E7|nr:MULTISPECIES: amino acid adenylation domain-containing protein [unclassified Mycobacterium]
MLTDSESSYYQPISSPRTTAARSVWELFELTVDRAPDAVAVTVAGRSFTYRELDAASNRLARRLRSRGVDVGSAVALCVGRTVAMAIGMLGILKAGGVYVPIDPSYPKDRVDDMLAEAGVVLLLGEDDVDGGEVRQESAERLEPVTAPDDLAYVMHTSGSTGRPKGVAVSHGSVVEYAETLGRELGISAEDVYLETASISFSSSIRQLLVPFAVGAQVVIATTEERRDAAELLRRISESRVTVADLVPTVVRGLVDAAAGTTPPPNGLRLLLTASEPLRLGVVRAWRERFGGGTTWINMYGQTETTGIVSVHRVGEPDGGDQCIVPIGRPRGNVSMYVLDKVMRPVPPGVSGELFIAGPALARGYLGDPELTAERFVRAPWNADERLYASGDVVRLGWDGTIEYRNRTDRQVKIRGLRVEPAEVDRVLLEHPGVREAVTVVQGPDGDGSVLVAYFAPQGTPVSVGELRAHARRQLPEHMVPSAFLAIDRLPQTPNGKLDLAALPVVAITRDQEVEYVAPRGDVEEALASIWRSILDVEQIGAGDNFFALGGHSLLAAQVRSRIRQHLGVELSLDVLFDDQTLAGLARRIEETATGTVEALPLRPAARGHEMPASHAQETMWRAEREDPGSAAHWIDVSIRITGPLDAAVIVRGVQDVVARNELLRTTFRASEDSSTAMLTQVILDSYVPEVPITDGVSDGRSPDARDWRDLGTQPPFRADVMRVADDHHVLRLRVHRIVADGYSMRLLLGELGGLVASSLGFDDFPVLDGQLQYADYAVWERSWLTGDALTRRVDHFRRQFATADLPAALPTDHPRTDQPHRRGCQFAFEFPPAVAAAARALAVLEQASLYSVLLAAFARAVGTYADQSTVVIAAPLTRRTDPAMQLMIGPFMNTVPLRIDLDAGTDLPGLVRDVKTTVLGALSNQDAPWHLVLAALAEQHGPSALGIGELCFLMDDPVPGELTAGGLSVSRIPPAPIVLRRELTVAMSTKDDQLTGTVTYDGALFEETSIAGIVSNFIAALTVSDVEKV